MFGLPAGTSACLFDMDGVVTQTALVHAAAWKEMFDNYLRQRAQQTGEKFVPFDSSHDYDNYVDGKPRLDGTQSFLQSRGINLPEGSPDDKPGSPTIYGLSNEKNNLVVEKIHTDGVKVYDGTIRYVKAVRAAGLRTAIVSSSANTVDVLNAAGIAELFDARVDGIVAKERPLTPSWPPPRTWASAPRTPPCSRTHSRASRPATPGISPSSSGSTG